MQADVVKIELMLTTIMPTDLSMSDKQMTKRIYRRVADTLGNRLGDFFFKKHATAIKSYPLLRH